MASFHKIQRNRAIPILSLAALLLCSAGTLHAQDKPSPWIHILLDPAAGSWQPVPNPPFPAICFTGETEKGLVVFGGIENRQTSYLIDRTAGRWEFLADAPFPIIRCTGDNINGVIVAGGPENRQVAYMVRYNENVWKTVAPVPFPVRDIAGSNDTGPIVAAGPEGRTIYYMRDYRKNVWISVADAPFEVIAVTGTNARGIIVAGGRNNRQVAFMKDYEENVWHPVADAPFSIVDIAGNNESGPVILGGIENRQAASLTNYADNKWRILPDAPVPSMELAGTNAKGILVRGGPSDPHAAKAQPGGPPLTRTATTVLKTAVVEFSEKGDLGIQDAGSIIAEWMTTALNKTGAFEVYERLSLSKLMEEHKLGQTGLLDDKTIAEIGRIRGVEAIITGSVLKFGNVISVTAKLIDVVTAKIIRSSDIKVNDVNAVSTEIDRLARELVP
jgi:TolB-like protein